jgi:hypothetical protein
VEDAARDPEVDGVDRSGRDPYPNLAGAGLDDGNVDDLDRVGSAGVRTTAARKVDVLILSSSC